MFLVYSYLVYFTAMKVHQPGHVTRIVSGCDPEEAHEMVNWFNNHVQLMSSRFHLHLTPDFSKVYDEDGNVIGDYKFFNKPRGSVRLQVGVRSWHLDAY
jgi:hypothetical protein